MTKILIAVDGSKASVNALDYVANRKRQGEAIEVLLLNVQPLILPHGRMVTRRMIEEYQTQESEKVFTRAGLKARKRYLGADEYVETGDPAECIINFARKSKCDEIVMGSRGLNRMKGLLLGSVVTKVVQLSETPVVVVK